LKRGDLVTVVVHGDFGKPRPALVIQSDQIDETATVTVLLLTSTLRDAPLVRHTVDPTPTNGLRTRSQVQIDRAQSIPRAKVGVTIGRLENAEIATISALLALFLGIA
jgi:mRNA interferase MazF